MDRNDMPNWFKRWEENHFRTLSRRVWRIETLVYIILGAVLAAAVANLFTG
jgi:hypothetical protein